MRIGDEESEATVLNQKQPSGLMFAPEPPVNNQLELQSQSEHNTVMGQSPVKPQRSVRSKRRGDAPGSKVKTGLGDN